MPTFSVQCKPHWGLPAEATAEVNLGDFDQVERGIYLVNDHGTFRPAVGRFDSHLHHAKYFKNLSPQHALQFIGGGFDIVMAQNWPGPVMGRIKSLTWDCLL